MSHAYQHELPARRLEDRDLPMPVVDRPYHEWVQPDPYPNWSNLASQRHVRGLAVDPDRGELWLATGGGVLRWWPDAQRFTRYASEHGLVGNSVLAVAVDGSSRVWAVPEAGGLQYLDNNVWRSYSFLGEARGSLLSVESEGRLWAVNPNGLYTVVDPQDRPAVELPPPVGLVPRTFAVRSQGDLWLADARGLHHFDGTSWKCLHLHPGILTAARQGDSLWLGTVSGLIRIDLKAGEVQPSGDWPSGSVTALCPVFGGIWSACDGQIGLATEGHWQPLQEQRLGSRVTSLAPAGENEVWIGTHAGLLRGGPAGMRFQLTDGPPDIVGLSISGRSPATFSNAVQALAVQRFGNRSVLWIGSAGGLFRVDLMTEKWTTYSRRDLRDVRAVVATTAVTGSAEKIWVASGYGGLFGLHKSVVRVHLTDLPSPTMALAVGTQGRFWAADLNGLHSGDGLSWELVVAAAKLPPGGWIRTMVQIRPKCILLGTSVGLFSYTVDTQALSPVVGTAGSADVRCLLATRLGESTHLWVGTARGLYTGPPEALGTLPDLDHHVVTALAFDRQTGILWVGTDGGLLRLSAGGDKCEVTRLFSARNSGLAGDRVTALALSDGEAGGKKSLWIGTPFGLSHHQY